MFHLALLLLPMSAVADPLEPADWMDGGSAEIGAEELPAPIVNGDLEEKWPQAVALGAANFSACTGSLIAPRVVLTAGHCGDGMPVELLVSFGQAIFGPSVNEATARVGFVDFEIHPDYSPLESNGAGGQNLPEFDVALLELAEDAPIEPIWINTRKLKDRDVGEEVFSVGYGITSAAGQGGGTKRSATLVVDEIDDQFVLSNVSTNENQANICSGDSGGPQYHYDKATDTWEQWAIHSWGDANCVFNSGSTRTDVAADFILDFVDRVHGTTDFCELTGRYGDGVCDDTCEAPDPDCNLPGSGAASLTSGGTSESKSGCDTVRSASWAWLVLLPLLGYRRRR